MACTNCKSEGLGDTIAKITSATKLDKLSESIAAAAGKDDCGCAARREKLNKMFPYNGSRSQKTFPTKE